MYTDRTIPFECSTRGWYLDKVTNIGKNKKIGARLGEWTSSRKTWQYICNMGSPEQSFYILKGVLTTEIET